MLNLIQKQDDVLDKVSAGGGSPSPIDTSQLARSHDISSLHETQKMTLELIEQLRYSLFLAPTKYCECYYLIGCHACRSESRDLRNALSGMSNVVNRIGAGSPGGAPAGGSYDSMKSMINIQEQLDSVRNSLITIQQKQVG